MIWSEGVQLWVRVDERMHAAFYRLLCAANFAQYLRCEVPFSLLEASGL